MVVAVGVILGGVLQLLLQLPTLRKLKLLPRWDVNWRGPGVSRVLKLMVPALFGVSVAQLSLLMDNLFASFLPAGSLSWLYYSDRLTYLPLGLSVLRYQRLCCPICHVRIIETKSRTQRS